MNPRTRTKFCEPLEGRQMLAASSLVSTHIQHELQEISLLPPSTGLGVVHDVANSSSTHPVPVAIDSSSGTIELGELECTTECVNDDWFVIVRFGPAGRTPQTIEAQGQTLFMDINGVARLPISTGSQRIELVVHDQHGASAVWQLDIDDLTQIRGILALPALPTNHEGELLDHSVIPAALAALFHDHALSADSRGEYGSDHNLAADFDEVPNLLAVESALPAKTATPLSKAAPDSSAVGPAITNSIVDAIDLWYGEEKLSAQLLTAPNDDAAAIQRVALAVALAAAALATAIRLETDTWLEAELSRRGKWLN